MCPEQSNREPVRRSLAVPALFILLAMTISHDVVAGAYHPGGDHHHGGGHHHHSGDDHDHAGDHSHHSGDDHGHASEHHDVLLQLPDAERNMDGELAQLRAEFSDQPADTDMATNLVNRYFDLHRLTGDPRLLSYAESALSTHERAIGSADPAPGIPLARAHLQQAEHDFSGAVATLENLLTEHPRMTAAWLMRASIALVQGDYAEARRGCAQVTFTGRAEVGLVCAADLASLQGRSEAALQQLQQLLRQYEALPPDVADWAYTTAAEIALRLGDEPRAEDYLGAALAEGPTLYTQLMYADLLIAQNRIREARRLVDGLPATDAVLIRRATLARATGDHHFRSYRAELEQRIATLALRGHTGHDREVALYHLFVNDNPKAAAEAATHNWSIQRESIDAHLLLEAAVAVGQPEVAAPVLAWMQENSSDDVRLLRLQAEVEAMSR